MLVSAFRGWCGVGVDLRPGPCHNMLAPEEGGRALDLVLSLMNPILGKSHNLSESYPQFPHLLSGTKSASLGLRVRGVLNILLAFWSQYMPASILLGREEGAALF